LPKIADLNLCPTSI